MFEDVPKLGCTVGQSIEEQQEGLLGICNLMVLSIKLQQLACFERFITEGSKFT